MSNRSRKIPKEDMDLINKSFESTDPVETIEKNSHGNMVKASKKVVNDKVIKINDFSGKVLRHQKSIHVKGQGTIIIGVRGDSYDDIPTSKRSLVKWLDSDFE